MPYNLNRIVKRALQSETRRATERRSNGLRGTRAAVSAGTGTVNVAGQVFPAANLNAGAGANVAVRNAGRLANAMYVPDRASGPVYNIGVASVPSDDGGGGGGPTYIAGNGIQIISTTIATKNKPSGGIGSDATGNYIILPTLSGLVVDSGGLRVGAGAGIDVLANTVAVDVTDIIDTTKGLTETANKAQVKLDPLAGLIFGSGGGIKMATPRDLSWNSIQEVTATDHSHVVASSNDVGTVHTQAILRSGSGGDLTLGQLTIKGNLIFSGGNRTISASNDLTLLPTGNLVFQPIGLIVYENSQESKTVTFSDSPAGIAGFRIWDNSPGATGNQMQLTINTLKADSIYARKFTADENRVARGEWFLTYSFGIVETTFDMPAVGATADVWFEEAPGLGSFKLFQKNHWLRFAIIDPPHGIVAMAVWFQVVDADGSGLNDYIQRQDQTADGVVPPHLARQQWRIRRMTGGFDGSKVYKGETAADFGLPAHMDGATLVPDQGIVYMSSLFESGGPFVQVQTFREVLSSVPQFDVRNRMGNLNGLLDYTKETWGFAAGTDLSTITVGDYAGLSGITIEATNGARLFNTDLTIYKDNIKMLTLKRTTGLTMRFDDINDDYDPMRVIAWYDDIDAPPVGRGDPQAVLRAYFGDQGGGRLVRAIQLESVASDTLDEEARISLLTSNYDINVFARLDISNHTLLSTGLYGSTVGLGAEEAYLGAHGIIGHGAFSYDRAIATVIEGTGNNDRKAGLTIEQQGQSHGAGGAIGDAVLHWRWHDRTGTDPDAGEDRWVSMGIDGTFPRKWRLSGNERLGISDYISIDFTTGAVSIPGFDYGSSPPPVGVTGGDGITVASSSISVNGTVARTSTVFTAGDGLIGGGSLGADRTFAVLTPAGSGLSVSPAGVVVNDALAGDGLSMGVGKIMAVDGTVVRTPATVVRTTRQVNTGDGLQGGGDLSTNRTLSVDASVVRTDRLMNSGDGLTGGGDLSANRTFAVDGTVVRTPATVVRTSRQILTTGALFGGGDLSADRTLGLTLAASNPGLTQAGNALAVDTSVVRTSRQINTGDGLAGGGDLSANRTLSVDGTVVRTSRVLTAGNGLTGGGDLSADRTFHVGAGLGMTVNVDDVAVNPAYAFAWTGAQSWASTAIFNGTATFNASPQVNANLNFISVDPLITSLANLTLKPVGDIVLDPTGNDVLPGGSGRVDFGDYNRKWGTIFGTELYVETLVPSYVMATIGGRVVVAPTTSLIADVTVGQTTIDVKHNGVIFSGTFVYLETAPGGVSQVESMQVTSGPTTITDGYRYSVSRGLSPTTAKAWLSGDAVLSLGKNQYDGYIDLASVSTIHSQFGPTVTIYARKGGTQTWNNTAPVVTMGNLSSFAGISTSVFGFAAANDLTLSPSTGLSGFVAGAVGGMKMYNTDIEIYDAANKVLSINRTTGIAIEYGPSISYRFAHINWYDDLSALTISKVPNAYIGVVDNPTHTDLNLAAGQGITGAKLGTIYLNTPTPTGLSGGLFISTTNISVAPADTPTSLVLAGSGVLAKGIGLSGGPSVPTSTFHIWESNNGVGATTGLLLQQAGASGDARMQFSLLTGTTQDWTLGIDRSNGRAFSIAPGTDLSSSIGFNILPAGLVGINTLTPRAALDMAGGAIAFDSYTSANSSIIQGNVTDASLTTYAALLIRTRTDHIVLQAGLNNANPRRVALRAGDNIYGLVVDATGLISVGHAGTPSYLIDAIQDTTGAARISMRNPNAGTSAQALMQVQNDLGRTVQMGIVSSNVPSAGGLTPGDGYLQAGTNLVIRTTGPQDLVFNTNLTNRMRLYSTGELYLGTALGIGATDPTAPLTIAIPDSTSASLPAHISLRSGRQTINTSISIIGNIEFVSNDTQLTAPGVVVARMMATAFVTHTPTALDTNLRWFTTQGTNYFEHTRMWADGNLEILTGGLKLQGGSALTVYDQNTITWNPLITSTGTPPTISYTTRNWNYTKVGNWAFVRVHFQIATVSGGTGNVRVNMPFPPMNTVMQSIPGFYNGFPIIANSDTTSALTNLYYSGGGAIPVSSLVAGQVLTLTGVFQYQ